MTDPDLTPAEARAEVEAFLGPGWIVVAHQLKTRKRILARHGDFSYWAMSQPTYRAAVDALLQAWRDAVRPWCLRTLDVAEDCIVSWESGGGDNWAYQTEQGDPMEASEIVSRVLKEDDK